MGFSLFPKNERFFDLFSASATNIREAAVLFLDLLENYVNVEKKIQKLKEVESKGDTITHDIIDYLNASFITPIDREDIHALAGNLDEVLDELEGVGNRMCLFAIEKPTPECIELGQCLLRGAEQIEQAIKNLKNFAGLKDFLVEINSIENQCDQITRRMVAQLFHKPVNSPGDVVDLIKWKEIYTRLEHAADRMEDVADVIEDIVVKHS